jgi:hypothetical protein
MTNQTTTPTKYSIDLTEAIPDITANVIHDSRFNQLPSDIFEKVVFKALNNLIDDFAQNTNKYLLPEHSCSIEQIAANYLASDSLDKSELEFYFGS